MRQDVRSNSYLQLGVWVTKQPLDSSQVVIVRMVTVWVVKEFVGEATPVTALRHTNQQDYSKFTRELTG